MSQISDVEINYPNIYLYEISLELYHIQTIHNYTF